MPRFGIYFEGTDQKHCCSLGHGGIRMLGVKNGFSQIQAKSRRMQLPFLEIEEPVRGFDWEEGNQIHGF